VVSVEGGASPAMPQSPMVALTIPHAAASVTSVPDTGKSTAKSSGESSKAAVHRGKYLKSFSYTGPTKDVHIEGDAKVGKKIYLDRDDTFVELPAALRRADWIQAAHADRLYNAVDLMEIPAPAGSVVYVAHDNRLDRPAWLTKQFQPTDITVTIDGHPLKVFQHKVEKDESLTLGTNTENEKASDCSMYIVFVNAQP
jgi:beta-galactosidase